MNNYDLVTANPEDLFIEYESSEEIFDGGVDTVALANQLDAASAVAIGRLLADYQTSLAPMLSSHLVELLKKKIWDATPDQLEDVVQEAKAEGRDVWQKVRLAVMQRNEYQASQVGTCNNVPAMDMMLKSMAKSGTLWLPRPVYDAMIETLRKMISTATMTQLDVIGDFVGAWRCRGVLLEDIKARDKTLVRSVSRYEKTFGYVVRSGARQELVDKARRALRMVENGWSFVE